MIPKKIHHIWLQGGIPEKYHESYEKWNNFYDNIDYHVVWDEQMLLNLCNEREKEEYKTINTLINKVNYLKYILLYNEGGIYVDLDTIPVKQLDDFFNSDKIEDINLISTNISNHWPFNLEIPIKKFYLYDIIIPSRNMFSYYPNKGRALLLDNPILMSNQGNIFWLNLLRYCSNRNNIKEKLPHEPYGPYGITDFIVSNFENPFQNKILITPFTYFLSGKEEKNTYIIHFADSGW